MKQTNAPAQAASPAGARPRGLPVSKYHGCGNDFLLARETDTTGYDLQKLIVGACDRHTGIGADGFILVREQPLTMLFYNCDGSRAPMCGNGLRCFARFCLEEGIVASDQFDVQTLAGTKTVTVTGRDPFVAKVAMGKADFSPESVGLTVPGSPLGLQVPVKGATVPVDSFFLSTVHTVWFTDEPEDPQTQRIAGLICRHPWYGEQTNVNMVKILDRRTIRMRTWERGVGMTLACGTGACAAALDAYRKGACEQEVTVLLPKGSLQIQIEPDGSVWMSGPAKRICKGVYEG